MNRKEFETRFAGELEAIGLIHKAIISGFLIISPGSPARLISQRILETLMSEAAGFFYSCGYADGKNKE